MKKSPFKMDKPLYVPLLLLAGMVYFASAQLRGPEGAVCTRQASRQVMYTVENRRRREPSSGIWDYLRMWDVFGVTKARHPRSLVTVYATEYFTDYECCVGWNRIGDTCQADCYYPCEHGLCVDTNLCECDEGWEGLQCEYDVDECWYETDECDRENGACINTEGSYNCTCNDGLHLINGTVCHEIPDTDECARGVSGCEQNCHNTHGSYYCTCDAGYTLAADGHTCTDIDECATNNHDCDHGRNFCHNVPGGWECSCRRNYRLVDGRICRGQTSSLFFAVKAQDVFPSRYGLIMAQGQGLAPYLDRLRGKVSLELVSGTSLLPGHRLRVAMTQTPFFRRQSLLPVAEPPRPWIYHSWDLLPRCGSSFDRGRHRICWCICFVVETPSPVSSCTL